MSVFIILFFVSNICSSCWNFFRGNKEQKLAIYSENQSQFLKYDTSEYQNFINKTGFATAVYKENSKSKEVCNNSTENSIELLTNFVNSDSEKITVQEDKTPEDCLKFSTKDNSNDVVYIRIFLPKASLIMNDFNNIDFHINFDKISNILCVFFYYLFFQKSYFDFFQSEETFINGLKKNKIFNYFSIANKEIMYISRSFFNVFKDSICIFGYFYNEIPLQNSNFFEYSYECISVRNDFIGWAFYIKIGGSACKELKHLRISFTNGCFGKFLFFNEISITNCFGGPISFNKIDNIWLRRNKKFLLAEQIRRIGNVSKWMKEDGYDVFEQIFLTK